MKYATTIQDRYFKGCITCWCVYGCPVVVKYMEHMVNPNRDNYIIIAHLLAIMLTIDMKMDSSAILCYVKYSMKYNVLFISHYSSSF